MKSIKTRLVGNFILIVFISVLIFEALLISVIKHYYYNNLDEVLTNQIKISADFYSRYFSNTSLKDNVLDNVDVFWQQTTAQVQVVDLSGKVLMDSIGFINNKNLDTSDVKKALNGEKGKWVGKVSYDSSDVMAITYPLKSEDKIVGVLRFVSSLSIVNSKIKSFSLIFILIGVIVVAITTLLSIILAKTITEPLKNVTSAAEEMALGNLSFRIKKEFDDEIGKLSDTLNVMADEIQKKDQIKNEFISSISHELRTPLTSIKGWAITLNSDDMDDKALLKDGLSIIEKESDRLGIMVEDLLDFSKFVSGKITLSKKQTDLNKVIDYIHTQLTPRAARDKINFVVEKCASVPLIYVDENRIKQVLINVLDNAFKFTEENGTVSLKLNLNQEKIEIVIDDTGCGISDEDLPKIKEKFYKGKSSKSQNGIGLSISDEIMNLHGGNMHIESTLGKGTTVYLTLPLNK